MFAQKLTEYTFVKVALALLIIALFIRFPFFFRDYIDRDESTFILMGQSWVDGHLPFTELWDVKPPLTFFFFASIIFLFGKSFIAIRFFGTILVVLTALLTYKITLKFSSKITAFWTAIGCILLQSMFGSIQGVMSEHISMPFLMASMYFILNSEKKKNLFLSGLSMGIAIMIKLNLAYVGLFFGLFVLIRKKWSLNIGGAIIYGLGIIIVFLLTFFPYYFTDNIELFWKSVVEAPLNYSAGQGGPKYKLFPLFFLVIGLLFFTSWKRIINWKDKKSILLFIAILGVLLSFYKAGRVNSHYLIQLFPIFIIFVGIVCEKLVIKNKLQFSKKSLLLLLLLPMESYIEVYNIIDNKIQFGTYFNGEGFSVPNYINKNELDTNNILFLEYHIGYWVLNKTPPTKAATQPSNLCKSEMFDAYDNPRKNALEEIQYILEELQPKTIITRQNKLIFDKKHVEENKYINTYLSTHYEVLAVVEKAEVLQRLNGH